MRRRCGIGTLAALAAALALAPAAAADLADEQALAERYAPVVRLVEQTEECGPGEPYEPMDVDRLFGERTVALRGPWNNTDLVKIAPTANDIAGLYEQACKSCHTVADTGAPLSGDRTQWDRRWAKGETQLLNSTIRGLNGMPAGGQCFSCSPDDYKALIRFMAGRD